jgi:site-specific DNA-methyltransferase (adenine-specific)
VTLATWLMHGDCLEKMTEIPDGSVDLILADLPYGMIECTWDSIIPMAPLWDHYWRVLKPKGIVALFGSEPFSSQLRMNQFEYYKYDWIWVKSRPTGFQHAKNRPMKRHEIVSVFSRAKMGHEQLLKDLRMPYNPQGLSSCEKLIKGALRKFGGIIKSRPSHINDYVSEYTNYPDSVLNFDSASDNYHPTQKPVDLLEYLIRTYTNEGDTILDNVMGSGSTGVACKSSDRNFIGIERNEKYFHLAKQRIESDEFIQLKVTGQVSLYEEVEF